MICDNSMYLIIQIFEFNFIMLLCIDLAALISVRTDATQANDVSFGLLLLIHANNHIFYEY